MKQALIFIVCTLTLKAAAISFVSSSQLDMRFNLEHFSTVKNYSGGGGTLESLPNGQSYQNTKLTTEIQWLQNNRWNYSLALDFVKARSTNSDFTREQTNPSELRVKFERLLWGAKAAHISGVGGLILPLSTVSDSTNNVLLGEGANAVEGGAFIQKRLGRLTTDLDARLRYQDGGRALVAPMDLRAQLSLAKDWAIAGHLNGMMTVVADQYTGAREKRRDVTDRVNGGSFRYYSINPQYYGVGLEAWWAANLNWDVSLGYNQTLNGQSSASGNSILASLVWHMSRRPTYNDSPSSKESESEESFRTNDQQPYDENLFKD